MGFLETFRVPVRGNTLPLAKIAVISRQGDRMVISPFDPASGGAIVKALTDAKLNAYALNPKSVCVSVPPPSGDQRTVMARHVKKLGEEAKVAIRGVRQDARKQIAAWGRGSQRAVQEAHRRRHRRDRPTGAEPSSPPWAIDHGRRPRSAPDLIARRAPRRQ